jgi:hypothetical protein
MAGADYNAFRLWQRPDLKWALREQAMNFIKSPMNKIHEINQKYAHPKIHQSPMVRVSLLLLRIYLLLLVALLVYKFVTVVRGG